jgi:hypothetical protein
MTGRRRKGLSRIEPGALIGLAVLALAYWGTVATLVMARNTSAVVEIGSTTIRPAEPPAPLIRIPPARPWCFADRFNARNWSAYHGEPRPIGLALDPPCRLPVRRAPSSYGILLAN